MKRLLLATSIVFLLAMSIYVASCGQVDPAYAPVGSSVVIMPEGETWTFGCNEIDIPASCSDAFSEFCLNGCDAALAIGITGWGDTAGLGLTDDYQQCIATNTPEACASYFCEDLGYWRYYCAADGYMQVLDYLLSKIGRCGYKSYIVSALVSGATQQTAAEGSASTADPLNDVEISWIASDGEMYQLQDIPGQIAPLSNPFYDQTDERGLSQIKYRIPLPQGCGITNDYLLEATIGVAYDQVKFSFTTEESEVTTDDDTM